MRYPKSIDKYYTKDEQIELVRAAKRGDRKAAEKLVVSHVNLVKRSVKNWRHHFLEKDDLSIKGMMAVLKGIGLFDETRGMKFTNYIVWVIRSELTRECFQQSRISKMPTSSYYYINEINKAVNKSGAKYIDEISRKTGIHKDIVNGFMAFNKLPVYISWKDGYKRKTYDGHDSKRTFGETLATDKNEHKADHKAFRNHMKKVISNALEKIHDARARNIIKLRFGLNNGESMSLEAVGDVYGISRERVRQIQNKTLGKLKRYQPNLKELLYA